VYAILELNSKVEAVEATEHESYPKAIKAVDGDVKLHILRDRFNWNEMFEDPETNQIVDKNREQNIYPSSSGVSAQGLKLNASNIKSKLQKSGVDFDAIKTIKSLLKLGVSDTTILETLKEQGYNPDTSYDLLQNYKEEYRREGEAKDGVYVEGKNPLANTINKAYRMALSPRGFLPKSMMIAKEVLQGMIDSEVKVARNNIRLLERKLNKYNDKELKEVVGKIDAYIRGDLKVELPSDLMEIASDMRNHVDDLSSKLIESGAIDSKESIENIRNNIGSYLNRSYKLFDKENYAESIPQSVIDKAKMRLKKDYRKIAEEESIKTGVDVNTILNKKVDAAIQNILKKDESNAFISAAKTGSKNLKSLKRKKDIPAEIRALMGEYGDPAFNYIQSVNKIESMVANQMFLNKMRDKGEGIFFFKEKTGNATELIAPEGSEQYNPLNGYYTTPEIKKALEGQTGFKFTGPLEFLQKPYEGYLKGIGFVKKMKTIYSIGTQAKNVIGIVPVLIANGYVTDFQSFKTAFKTLNNDIKGNNDADLNAKMDEYLKSGIIGSSVVVSEIKSMMNKGETFEDAMIKRLAETDENKLRYYAEHAWGNAKKIDKALITAYQTTDDFSKILGYEVEKKRYAKSKFGKEYSKLDSSQQQEINDIAAEIIKNNIPNYGRVGGLVKGLKALPIAGTFISFHAEAIRTAYNTVDQAIMEMQDPATRDIGVERMKGILAVSATATLLPALFGLSSIGNSEEDQEEDSVKYARMFMPEWDKNSSVLIYDQPKDGKFSYISMSASDPYGALSQAVNAAMSGENMLDSSIKALSEIVSPFFEQDMILASIGKMGGVINDYSNKKFSLGDSTLRFMEEFGKLIAPGTYTSAMRIDDAYFKKDESAVKEAIGQMTGFKPRKIDIPNQAMFISYKIKDQAAENKKAYTKVKRNFVQKKEGVTREDVKSEYMKVNASQKEIYGELINMYKGAIYLGTPKIEILKSMKAAGIPIYMIKGIAQGKIPDMNI
jgi:predicted methyltransferase MtxX (methanogen marker protein 4)